MCCCPTPDQSVRVDLNMTAYLPPAGRQGGVFLKGSGKREGTFFFCHDKHPQSLSKGWGLVDQSLKTIKLPYTGRVFFFFSFVCSVLFLGPFVFLLELSKYELISGTQSSKKSSY